MMRFGARYLGDQTGLIWTNEHPIKPGDEIWGPSDVVDYLLSRSDFEKITEGGDDAPEADVED